MYSDTDMRVLEALRRRGLKATPQRLAICRFVLGKKGHPCASTIYEEVRRLHPTVSLATVYKTIHILRSLGLVQEMCPAPVQARIDSRTEPHINMICLRCGAIEDFKDRPIQQKAEELARGSGLLQTVQRIDIHGLCQACARAKRAR